MGAKWDGHSIVEKATDFVSRLTQGRWQIASSGTIDALHAEIYELEKSLASAPTRPIRATRDSKALEPITEQQKIADLAG